MTLDKAAKIEVDKMDIDKDKKELPVGKDGAKEVVTGLVKKNLEGLKEKVVVGGEKPANDNAEKVDKEGKKIDGGVEAAVEKKELTPAQKELLDKLRSAKTVEQRVNIYSTAMDDLGVDAVVSGLIPEFGDAGSSVVSGIYMLAEAKKAGLGTMSYLKIIGLQSADFCIGAVPIVGDIADYFFKANKWSASDFTKKAESLVKEARAAGVPEEDIAKITQSAEKLPKLVNGAAQIYKGAKGAGLVDKKAA